MSVPTNPIAIQQRIFRDIIMILKEKGQSIEVLQDLLQLKKSALYSRINGKKQISIGELSMLLSTFQLNPSVYFSQEGGSVEVVFPTFTKEITSASQYIADMARKVTRLSEMPEVKLFYISSEIPIFNFFRYKNIALFKMYIFGKTTWELEHLESMKFSIDELSDPQMDSHFEQIDRVYTQMDSEEIWNTNFIDNTLNQIKYYAESDMFLYRATILLIIEELSKLIDDLEKHARLGYKITPDGTKGGDLSLFQNEITHTNNILLFQGKYDKRAFVTYDNPNYFQSGDVRFWDYSFTWYHKLKRKSHALSSNSEKRRLTFFNECRVKIKQLKDDLGVKA